MAAATSSRPSICDPTTFRDGTTNSFMHSGKALRASARQISVFEWLSSTPIPWSRSASQV
eukprot:4996796-Prorocentrum_lima.AAC.1